MSSLSTYSLQHVVLWRLVRVSGISQSLSIFQHLLIQTIIRSQKPIFNSVNVVWYLVQYSKNVFQLQSVNDDETFHVYKSHHNIHSSLISTFPPLYLLNLSGDVQGEPSQSYWCCCQFWPRFVQPTLYSVHNNARYIHCRLQLSQKKPSFTSNYIKFSSIYLCNNRIMNLRTC